MASRVAKDTSAEVTSEAMGSSESVSDAKAASVAATRSASRYARSGSYASGDSCDASSISP